MGKSEATAYVYSYRNRNLLAGGATEHSSSQPIIYCSISTISTIFLFKANRYDNGGDSPCAFLERTVTTSSWHCAKSDDLNIATVYPQPVYLKAITWPATIRQEAIRQMTLSISRLLYSDRTTPTTSRYLRRTLEGILMSAIFNH